GEDLRRIDTPGLYHLDQFRDIAAVVAVAHVDAEVLVHRLADGKLTRLLRIYADDAKRAGLGQGIDSPLQSLLGSITRLPFVAFGLARRVTVGRALRIDAHGIDGAVHADAIGQPAQGFDRIFTIEIDHLGTLAPGHVEAVVEVIDGKYARGTQQLGAGDGELTDRAGAEDGHGVAAADFGQLRAEIPGGEDIGEQDGLVVVDFAGQLHQADIGEGNTRHLGLQAVEGTGDFRAAVKGGAGLLAVGVGLVALGIVAGAAVAAVAAGDGGGHHHAITDVQVAHIAAQRLDDTHGLVTEDGALAHAADGAPHEMQVGAADGRCGNANDRIGTRLYLGFRHIL